MVVLSRNLQKMRWKWKKNEQEDYNEKEEK